MIISKYDRFLKDVRKNAAQSNTKHLFEAIANEPEQFITFCNTKELKSMYTSVFERMSKYIDKNQTLSELLVQIVEYDLELFIHSLNVTVYSLGIAHKIQLNNNAMFAIALSGLIHDIGKLSVPTEVLYKPGKLTAEEFEVMKKHSEIGFRTLAKTPLPSYMTVATLQHHERLDGTGYPNRLTSEQIHPFAKLIAVADVFDALTQERCYKKAMTPEKALNIILEDSGTKFDSDMVQAMTELVCDYPVNSLVKLNTDETYVVIRQTHVSYKPIIENINTYERIDLSKCDDKFIVEVAPTLLFNQALNNSKIA